MSNEVQVRDERAVQSMQIAIQIATVEDLRVMADILSKGQMLPQAFWGKPDNVMSGMLLAKEVGLNPITGLGNIAVINGRATLWGDSVKALVVASPLCESFQEWFELDGEKIRESEAIKAYATGKDVVAVCQVKRKGAAEPYIAEFSFTMAKVAGLIGKQGPWTTNPTRMLKMRARAFGCRDEFSDVLRGLRMAEEMLGETIELQSVGEGQYGVAPEPTQEEANDTKSKLKSKLKMPKAAEWATASKVEPAKETTKAEPLPSDGAKVASKKAEVVTPEPSGHQLGTVTMVRYTGKDGSPYANSEGMPFVVFTMENNGKSLDVCYFGKPSVLGVKTMDDLLGHDLRFLVKSTTGLGGRMTHTIFDVIPADIFEEAMAERAAKESKEE